MLTEYIFKIKKTKIEKLRGQPPKKNLSNKISIYPLHIILGFDVNVYKCLLYI